jgi:ADP-ribose pyrophosphatase YjhB (NUDIX family)
MSLKREYPDRPIVGVGAIIIDGDRVLLARRASQPLSGQWSIPGGMLELGETLRAGAEREALEETGLRVHVDEVVDVFDSIVPGQDSTAPQYHYVLIDFLCTVIGGELHAGSDASEVRWFRREEIDRLGMRQMTINAIEKAFGMRGRSV